MNFDLNGIIFNFNDLHHISDDWNVFHRYGIHSMGKSLQNEFVSFVKYQNAIFALEN